MDEDNSGPCKALASKIQPQREGVHAQTNKPSLPSRRPSSWRIKRGYNPEIITQYELSLSWPFKASFFFSLSFCSVFPLGLALNVFP